MPSKGRKRNGRDVPDGMHAFELTDAELAVKATALADLCGEIDQIKEDHAHVAKAQRELIRSLEDKRSALAEDVSTGTELRDSQLELVGRKGQA